MGLTAGLFDEIRLGCCSIVFSKIAGVTTFGVNSYCLAANSLIRLYSRMPGLSSRSLRQRFNREAQISTYNLLPSTPALL